MEGLNQFALYLLATSINLIEKWILSKDEEEQEEEKFSFFSFIIIYDANESYFKY